MVTHYRLEKDKQLKSNTNKDYIKERRTDNGNLFGKIVFNIDKKNYDIKISNSIFINIIQEQEVSFQRKR